MAPGRAEEVLTCGEECDGGPAASTSADRRQVFMNLGAHQPRADLAGWLGMHQAQASSATPWPGPCSASWSSKRSMLRTVFVYVKARCLGDFSDNLAISQLCLGLKLASHH
jgi:hypothetical protein